MLFDGSSSAKTVDEKELCVIKTCNNGKARFDVLALEQPDDAKANGLRNSLDNALSKGNFTLEHKHHKIGLGSDGTNTNKALYHIENEEIGEHLLSVLCLSHKLELAIHDAFKVSDMNEDAEEQLESCYYLFKKSNLKWQSYKKHSIVIGKKYRRFKCPSGTR